MTAVTAVRWSRPIHWYQLLTLDRTVCSFCFRAPRTAPPPSIRSLAGYAPVDRFRNKALWMRQAKTAFRKHVREVHPEMLPNIKWTATR